MFDYKRITLIVLLQFVLVACGSDSGSVSGTGSSATNSTGQGGSMARFSIVGDTLYTIAGPSLQLFSIQDAGAPESIGEIYVDSSIETLFAYSSNLFIGSQRGVFIYDISDSTTPHYVSEFEHEISCDPVVVQGSIAYITLRSDAFCWRGSNRLDIVDVSDIQNPRLIKSYPMQQPKGLGVDGNKLFVCDGFEGLKVFDVTEPTSLMLLEQKYEVNCFDVIANNNNLVVSDDFGLLQYNYGNIPLEMLSEIRVVEANPGNVE